MLGLTAVFWGRSWVLLCGRKSGASIPESTDWGWISNPRRIAAHRATNSTIRSTHLLDVTQALFLGGELYVDLSDIDGFTPNSASFAKTTASSTLTSSMRLRNSLSLSSGGTADSSIASRACICPSTVINPSILRWLFIREILTPSLD